MVKAAVLLLTREPTMEQVYFMQAVQKGGYDFRVVIDDNMIEYSCDDVRFIQYDNAECEAAGWKHVNQFIRPNSAAAWEKGLRWALESGVDYAWFLEDDVFVPNVETFRQLDTRYSDADILSAANTINATGTTDGWCWWAEAKKAIEAPWASSMVCAVRMSRRVLQAIDEYRQKHGQLCFLEFMFHTLALHKGYTVQVVPELAGIVFQRNWTAASVRTGHLYHPVKAWDRQKELRSALGL